MASKPDGQRVLMRFFNWQISSRATSASDTMAVLDRFKSARLVNFEIPFGTDEICVQERSRTSSAESAKKCSRSENSFEVA